MDHNNVVVEKTMKKELYIKKEVAEILNTTPRTIHYYTDEGLVVPVENPTGRGKTRRYSFENVVQLAVVRELAATGFDLKTIGQIIYARKAGVISSVGGDEVLIVYDGHTDGGRVVITASDADGAVRLGEMSDRKIGVIINIDKIRREVQDRIERI